MKRSKFLTGLLSLALLFSIAIPASASNTQIISIDEYEAALKEAYQKYDIKVEILEYDKEKTLTRDMLNEDLKGVDHFANSIKIVDVSTPETESTSPILRSMPVTSTKSEPWMITSDYGYANMRTSANATVDVQNNTFIGMNWYRSEQIGNFVNYDDSNLTVSAAAFSNGEVRVNTSGTARFSHVEPRTGLKIGVTVYVGKNCTFQF